MQSQVARFPVLLLLPIVTLLCVSSAAQRPFTPKDDVGLRLFEYGGRGAPGGVIKYSPDGQYFAVVTERGRLDLNAPEDTIWLFNIADIQRFVQSPGQGHPPSAVPLAQFASDKDGPLIENLRWLSDSSGVAFTAAKKSPRCKFHQLFVANVRTGRITALTPEDQDIGSFDIRTDSRFVYEVNAPGLITAPKEDEKPAAVLTGKDLWSVMFPDFERRLTPFDAAGLWAVIDGKRRQVLDAKSYQAPASGLVSLSMSPDGHSVVAILQADHPPAETWRR